MGRGSFAMVQTTGNSSLIVHTNTNLRVPQSLGSHKSPVFEPINIVKIPKLPQSVRDHLETGNTKVIISYFESAWFVDYARRFQLQEGVTGSTLDANETLP